MISGSEFVGNLSREQGAAIAVSGMLGNSTISRSIFTGNLAEGTGGDLSLDVNSSSRIRLENSQFRGNHSPDHGGAIFLAVDGQATLRSLVFQQNVTEASGGAIYFYGSSAAVFSKLTMTNNAAGFDGGGLAKFGAGALQVTDSRLQGNMAFGNGGGIMNDDGSPAVLLSKTTVSGNFAMASSVGSNLTGDFTGAIPPKVKAPKVTYQVNSLEDNEISGDGFLTLREAILVANAAGKPASIGFAPDLQGRIVLGPALPTITTSLSILGKGADRVQISGNNLYRIFEFDAPGVANMTVANLALLAGKASGGNGGAILNQGENLTVRGSLFVQNTADDEGGAIFHTGRKLTLSNSSFYGNDATTNGAGIAAAATGAVTVHSSQFFSNSAAAGTGGFHLGLAASGKAIPARLEGLAIVDQFGRGGSLDTGGASGVSLSLKNSLFVGNQNPTNPAGGLLLDSQTSAPSKLQIEKTFFTQNYTPSVGGLQADLGNRTSLSLKNTDFIGNRAVTTDIGGAWFTGSGQVSWKGGGVAGNSALSGTPRSWIGGLGPFRRRPGCTEQCFPRQPCGG